MPHITQHPPRPGRYHVPAGTVCAIWRDGWKFHKTERDATYDRYSNNRESERSVFVFEGPDGLIVVSPEKVLHG